MHRFPSHIQTDRLIIRLPDFYEAEEQHKAITECINDLKDFLEWAHPTPTLQNRRSFIQRAHKAARKAESFDTSLYKKETGEFIGGCGFVRLNEIMGEIGFFCLSKHRGNGYISEAVNALVDFGFNTLNLKRIECGYYNGNEASKAVSARCGFEQEAVLKSSAYIAYTQKTHDVHITVKFNPNHT